MLINAAGRCVQDRGGICTVGRPVDAMLPHPSISAIACEGVAACCDAVLFSGCIVAQAVSQQEMEHETAMRIANRKDVMEARNVTACRVRQLRRVFQQVRRTALDNRGDGLAMASVHPVVDDRGDGE